MSFLIEIVFLCNTNTGVLSLCISSKMCYNNRVECARRILKILIVTKAMFRPDKASVLSSSRKIVDFMTI